MKRTPGISNPVNVRDAEIDRMCKEDHATDGARLLMRLEQQRQARKFMARLKAGMAKLVRR